jgi:hypothetical protein
MSDACPYCPPLDPAQVVRFADDLVLYLEDERHQGSLPLHVIPRFRQEPLAGKGIRAHLKSEANR